MVCRVERNLRKALLKIGHVETVLLWLLLRCLSIETKRVRQAWRDESDERPS